MTKVGLYAIGKSTTLESNKSLARKPSVTVSRNRSTRMDHSLLGVVALCVVFTIYMIPLLVADHRHHPQKMAIGVLSLLLGWTVLGWVIALVWACTAIAPPRVHRVEGAPLC